MANDMDGQNGQFAMNVGNYTSFRGPWRLTERCIMVYLFYTFSTEQ